MNDLTTSQSTGSTGAVADRVLDATLACVARVGVAKTTLDDVAKEAGCARATVYRCFPGRLALTRAVLEREVAALADRVIGAADRTETLGDAIAAVILSCAQTFNAHPALAFVLEHEPELVAPQLSFERGSAVIMSAGTVVAPAFSRFIPAERAERLGEWVARITLSYLCNPLDEGHLDDPAFVRALVDDFVLPGVTHTVNTFASASNGEGVPK
jgi:AcrR family transcriptional regulator